MIFTPLKIQGAFLIELEPKLILQKNLGLFTIAYNIAPEMEWEGPKLADLEQRMQSGLKAVEAMLRDEIRSDYELADITARRLESAAEAFDLKSVIVSG